MFLAPWLVEVAIGFGPEDYFALMCVAFITVSATFGASPIRGLTSLFIGLALGLVGIDKLTGQSRLHFGVPELLDGIEITTLAVGLFAVGEALYVASRRHLIQETTGAGARLALDDGAGLGALVEAVAARHGCSDFRSARCPRAAPKSRPSCPIRPSAS